MDVLSEVLRAVRLSGAKVFFDMEAHSPWVGTTPPSAAIAGLVMPEAEHVICFHALTAGSCWAELADGSSPPMPLSAGDIVIIPRGDARFSLHRRECEGSRIWRYTGKRPAVHDRSPTFSIKLLGVSRPVTSFAGTSAATCARSILCSMHFRAFSTLGRPPQARAGS